MIKNFVTYFFGNFRNSPRFKEMISIWVANIRLFYPYANLYIMSDQTNLHPQVSTLPIKIGKSPMLEKFKVYSFFKEPFMYTDLDVSILKPFREEHLVKTPVNFFKTTRVRNMPKILDKPLEDKFKKTPQVNAGIFWSYWPSEEITLELQDIHNTHFSVEGRPFRPTNDEHAESFYVMKHNLHQVRFPEVNVFRNEVDSFRGVQSLHYHSPEFKDLFFKERCRRLICC